MKFVFTIVLSGIILLFVLFLLPVDNHSFGQSQIQNVTHKFEWIPFDTDQELEIQDLGLDSHHIFLLNGTTLNQNGGFTDYHRIYQQSVVLTTGIIDKTNKRNSDIESQFTISFNVIGENKNYSLVLVNGRPPQSGWNEETFYVKMQHNATVNIDFNELTESVNDKYIAIEKTILGLERYTDAQEIIFSIYAVDGNIPYVNDSKGAIR